MKWHYHNKANQNNSSESVKNAGAIVKANILANFIKLLQHSGSALNLIYGRVCNPTAVRLSHIYNFVLPLLLLARATVVIVAFGQSNCVLVFPFYASRGCPSIERLFSQHRSHFENELWRTTPFSHFFLLCRRWLLLWATCHLENAVFGCDLVL